LDSQSPAITESEIDMNKLSHGGESATPPATALRQRAEEIARKRNVQSPENIEALSLEGTRRTLHELRVHQIELETQNEELRRAQVELDSVRARYFELYDLAPVSYITLSEKGLILEANLATTTLLGVARGALVKQPITRFIFKEDQDLYYRLQKQLFETGEPQAGEPRMLKKDDTVFWAHLEAIMVQDLSMNPAQSAGDAPVFRAVMSDITERKRMEDALRASLEEKVVLLKETHHRVKNNLQIVASLLNLQAGRLSNPQAVTALHDTRNRVQSMALLHETLYRAENLARVNFAAYVEDLCRQLWRSLGPEGERIAIRKRVAPIGLPLEQSVPCGLIINELVSNALKHGFPDARVGEITVELSPTNEQRLVLSVRDNGVGLPPGFDSELRATLGLQLVSLLAKQLGGQLTVGREDGAGALFSVVFSAPVNVTEG
jgi:two-component system, sensor histidine kinase PdtaS